MRKSTFLSEDKLQVLLGQAKAYSPGLFYPLFLTFVETAAKSSEILSLKWDAIDFKKGTITCPGGEILASRTLPISKELRECLMRKRPVIEHVFTGIYDQKMTVRILAAYLNEFKHHYGIQERLNYLDLRHSYARNFLARGGDLRRLKEILGVRSLQTVEVVYGIHHAKRLEISSPYAEG
jgi:integrase